MTMLRRRPRYDYDAAMAGQPYAPVDRRDEFTWFDFTLTLLAAPMVIGWWLIRHWPVTIPAFLGVWVYASTGLVGLIVTTVVVVVALIVWRRAHPDSFGRFVVVPWSRWVRRLRYRRAWTATMHNAGLTRGFGSERTAPRIVRMRLRGPTDRLLVQLLAGQSVDELRKALPALGDTFGALRCTAVAAGPGRWARRPGRVWINLTVTDHLEAVVPPMTAINPAETVDQTDLSRLTIGVREDGTPWTVSLAGGSHLLIGGATGSGKSSVLWALMHALGPAIRDGWVQVWACDPKGGMELALGRHLFTRFAYGAVDGDMVTLLEDVERLIVGRAATYMGTTRSHVPTPNDPHVIVVLDELAGLTAYLGDRDLSKRLDRVLPRVLSQGRAVGVTVVGAIQDPRKRAVDMRSLFPTRIALRTSESDDVGLILTDGAHARGALCEHIPVHLPGVGYVESPDEPDMPIRVRAAYLEDEAIQALAHQYRPGGPPIRVDVIRTDIEPGRAA